MSLSDSRFQEWWQNVLQDLEHLVNDKDCVMTISKQICVRGELVLRNNRVQQDDWDAVEKLVVFAFRLLLLVLGWGLIGFFDVMGTC